MIQKKGVFISIEGIDGCGKTTLITYLKDVCTKNNIPILITKEPGGSPLGKHLRPILQQQETPLDGKAEFLLFAADRAQHIKEIIAPALSQGITVITDRCADSSLAYQGYGLGLDKEMIKQINRWAMAGTEPDIVVYLRINPTVAQERIRKNRPSLTTFEQRNQLFWDNVSHGYDEMFVHRKKVITIDASQDTSIVQATVWQHLKERIPL